MNKLKTLMADAKDILIALRNQPGFEEGAEQEITIEKLGGLVENIDQVEAQKLLFTIADIQPIGDGLDRRIKIPAKYFEGL